MEKEWMKSMQTSSNSSISIWKMILFLKRYVRYANSINHSITSVFSANSHYSHTFSNRAMDYGKRMDETEAYIKQQ